MPKKLKKEMMITYHDLKRLLILSALAYALPIIANASEKNAKEMTVDLSIFYADFEEAMGKKDHYMQSFYQAFTDVIHRPDHHFFRYVKPHSPFEMINLCRRLYKKNKPCITAEQARVPYIFHQIWVGSKPFPEKYKKWQKTLQSIPGWSYKLWTDEDVKHFDFPNKKLYLREKNMGARADILRVEILYQFGGVYADTDLEILKPEYFTVLNNSYDFYCALNPFDRRSLVINNAIIGSIPYHPILKAYRENIHSPLAGKENFATIVKNGPGLLTKMVILHADKGFRDIVFPATFFYPLGVEQMLAIPYKSMPDTLEKLERLKFDTCKSESLAIHWWEGSWKLPDAWAQGNT